MKKSTHRVEIVKINPEPHPNADALVIQKVFGYQVCLRKEDWVGVEYGAYIQPDSVVDTDRPEFSWLKGKAFREAIPGDTRFHKVCAIRLRDVLSFGLMVPAPEGAKEGDDVSDVLGVTRYQPTLVYGATEPPSGYSPEYDLEAFQRYAQDVFQEGEMVHVFEKLDGVNARYCFRDGKIHVGSKSIWLEEKEDSAWWKNLKNNYGIVELCKSGDFTVYGEIVGFPGGHKTKMRYGIPNGEIDFYVFDIAFGDTFLSWDKVCSLCDSFSLKRVPRIATMAYSFNSVCDLADGVTLISGANHHREGIVVRPMEERRSILGRSVLKMVSGRSLLG